MTANISQINIENIKNMFYEELIGYKYLSDLTHLRSGINIKYYDPVTQKLSKQASVLQVNYFSEIKRTNPMSLLLYTNIKNSAWKIIYKKYIIFRQWNKPSQEDKADDIYIHEQAKKYKNIEND
jgi:hypothetical protein